MDKRIFNLIFNNYFLRRVVFRYVRYLGDLKSKPSQSKSIDFHLKWKDVVEKPCVMLANGYVDLMKEYLSNKSADDFSTIIISKLFKSEIKFKNNDLSLFKYLRVYFGDNLTKLYTDEKSGYQSSSLAYISVNKVFASAAKYGRMDIVDYLQEEFPSFGKWDWYSAMVKSPLSNNLDILKYFVNKCTKQLAVNHKLGNKGSKNFKTVFDNAARVGSVPMLKFLHENRAQDEAKSKMFRHVVAGGHIDAFHYILKLKNADIAYEGDYLLEVAASNNQFQMLKLLVKVGLTSFYSTALGNAVKQGNLEILNWMRDQRPDEALFSQSIDDAVINGDLEIIKWIHCHSNLEPTMRTFDLAAKYGRFDILEYLWSNFEGEFSSDVIDEAAANGHYEVLKFVDERSTRGCSVLAMNAAAKNGHMNILQFLHYNRTEGCTKKAMDDAARYGRLDIVQWLHSNRTEGCTTDAMDAALYNGDLDIAQWLHDNRTEGCTEDAMDEAAGDGRLDVVQWLHKNRTEGCTSNAMDNAAKNGHLLIIQWLHYNRTEGCTSRAMEDALRYERSNVVQWLQDNRTDWIETEELEY